MIVYVALLVLSLVAATFAATAETALTSVSRIRIRSLAEEGDRRAQVVLALHANPNAYLSTILTLNTVAVIVASTAAALLAVREFDRVPEWVVTVVLSLFVLIFCEIAPKSLALRGSERIARRVAPAVRVLTRVLRPLVYALTAFTTLLLRTATRRGEVPAPFVTEEELKLLVTVGEQQGVVEQEEREMIHGILAMTDKAVREIMVPRVDVVGVEADGSMADVIQVVIDTGHSRIPVYEDTLDNIVGIVYAKDLLRHGVRSDDGRPLRELARDPYEIPTFTRVGVLLHEMQARSVHIAVVVDEYGGTAGIVTIEDLIEEIVGPIRDEYDIAEQEEIQFLNDSEVLMSGRVSIDDVKETLHLNIPDEVEADSIGGLVYERLGEIPKVGATVDVDGATLTVESVRRRSVQSVRITSPRPFLTERAASGEGHDAETHARVDHAG